MYLVDIILDPQGKVQTVRQRNPHLDMSPRRPSHASRTSSRASPFPASPTVALLLEPVIIE